jgi:streptogramin lyase
MTLEEEVVALRTENAARVSRSGVCWRASKRSSSNEPRTVITARNRRRVAGKRQACCGRKAGHMRASDDEHRERVAVPVGARIPKRGIGALAAALIVVVLAGTIFALRAGPSASDSGITRLPPVSPTAHSVTAARSVTGVTFTTFPLNTMGSRPQFIVRGADGNLWYTSPPAQFVSRMTPSGQTTRFPLPGFMHTWEIAAGTDGNIWVVEAGPNHIARITSSGQVAVFTAPLIVGAQMANITAGPDGNMWFTLSATLVGNTTGAGRAGRITPTGHITLYTLPDANGSPGAITSGPDGNLWFVDGPNNTVGRITPAGAIHEYAFSTANGVLGRIAAGPDGNLWCTEFKDSDTSAGIRDHIVRVTVAGRFTEFAFPAPANDPKGHNSISITAGPDGAMWFTEFGGNRIGRITPAGTITEYTPPAGAQGPYGITQGPGGTLWYVALNSNAIVRITLSYGS